MKKLLICICLLIKVQELSAQVMYPYTFTKQTSTYVDLIGAINITAGISWDDTIATVPIGFNFKWALGDRIIDSIMLDSYGQLYAPIDFDTSIDFANRLISPYKVDLVDKSYNTNQVPVSPISYQTTGAAGSRIFKAEFKNAGFITDTAGVDSTNFQVWLYEGSNVIEFHYGPQYVSDLATSFDGENGPWINLVYQSNLNLATLSYSLDSCTYIAGNATTPTAVNPTAPIDIANAQPADFAFVGLPNNGDVFRFAPYAINAGVDDVETYFTDVKVVSLNDQITINHEGQLSKAILKDVNGRTISVLNSMSNHESINTNQLSKGIYFLTLIDNYQHVKTFQLMK